MTDITKCKGKGCSLKESCYRYTSKEGMLQSFFVDSPISDGQCEMYWGKTSTEVYEQLKQIFKTNEK